MSPRIGVDVVANRLTFSVDRHVLWWLAIMASHDRGCLSGRSKETVLEVRSFSSLLEPEINIFSCCLRHCRPTTHFLPTAVELFTLSVVMTGDIKFRCSNIPGLMKCAKLFDLRLPPRSG
jgi:hypothetical protein